MKKQKQYYHYTECGLDNIYLVNGFKITKTADGTGIFISNIEGLHKVICMILISKKDPLKGKEIKFIRTMLDLSQTRLAHLLGCRYQQILLWEKNKNKISTPSDRLLRITLYTFLDNNHDNGKVFKKINEIADSNAADTNRKIKLKEDKDQWEIVV